MPDLLAHSLVKPNQLRAFGTTIQDNTFGGTMSLKDPDEIVRVPLELKEPTLGSERGLPVKQNWMNVSTIILAHKMSGIQAT
jgi:hypothetical protein